MSVVASDTFERPNVIRWGATTAELERDLALLCPKLLTRKIDPPFLDSVKNEQLQIDCDGFQFRGRPRHIELVMRDGQLVMVWLMVDVDESQSMIAAMKQRYGTPTAVNGDYIAFEKQRAAWRHKPAEFLFYSEALETEVEPWFR